MTDSLISLHPHEIDDDAIQDRTSETLTQQAFDTAAPVYDQTYEQLHGIRRLRRLISQVYDRYFAPGQHLLELNCGTGTDAIEQARKGVHVLATDVSPAMIHEVKRKLRDARLEHMITPRVLSYHDLHLLKGSIFDGAYSNMGGLNCTAEMGEIARHLAGLIRPGGYFIATVMTDFCLWETAAFLSRLQIRNALRRRKRGGVSAHLHGGTVQTYYYSPDMFASHFAPYFERIQLTGLNILTPPPNSTRVYDRFPDFVWALEGIDDKISGLPVFSAIGDHFLMVLRRKQTGGTVAS